MKAKWRWSCLQSDLKFLKELVALHKMFLLGGIIVPACSGCQDPTVPWSSWALCSLLKTLARISCLSRGTRGFIASRVMAQWHPMASKPPREGNHIIV